MKNVGTFSSVVAVGIAIAGCTGMVSGEGDHSVPGKGNNSSASSGGTGSGIGNGSSGTGSSVGTAAMANQLPGADLMHRLNTAEYNATVTDVLGTKTQPATANWRGGEIDGFDNIASELGVDDDQVQNYVDAAQTLASEVFASDALKAKVLTCSTTDDMACVSTIISQTGLRLFRRPLATEEVSAYADVYKGARAQGDDHTSSVKAVLWSLLASAQFLYRMEFDADATSKHGVSGYELASRLSYFLWSSAPDDALLASASQMNTDDAINAAVDRMLSDTKSARFVTNFAGQWLGARNVPSHPTDKTLYPTWTPDVASAAANEMFQFFDEFLRKNRPWTDFLKVDVNFLNQPLAAFYGIPNVSGSGTTRVEYAPDDRAGFLGLVGFLANSSVAARSSPTLRGKWLLVNLLCSPPPPPPANVPKLEDNNAHPESTNVRVVLEAHRSGAACKACHASLDPFGLALEQYDGVGHFRTSYPDKSAIDSSTSLPPSEAFPNGVTFAGLDGAEETVGSDPRFKSCISEKLYTYGLGRRLTEGDKTNAAALSKAWQEAGDLSIAKLIHDFAVSDPFKTRTPQ